MDRKLRNLFFNEKPAKLVVLLKQSEKPIFVSEISSQIDTTYAYTVKLVKKLEEQGVLYTYRDGRMKYVELTGKGEKIGGQLAKVYEDLDFGVKKTVADIFNK